MTDPTQAPSKDLSTLLDAVRRAQRWLIALATDCPVIDAQYLGLSQKRGEELDAAIRTFEQSRSAHEPRADEHDYATKQDLFNAGATQARFRYRYRAALAEIAGGPPLTLSNGEVAAWASQIAAEALNDDSPTQPPADDAARYQWLRHHIAPSIMARIFGVQREQLDDSRPEALDALIDERRTRSTKGGE